MKSARAGFLTPQMKRIAREEGIPPDDLLALAGIRPRLHPGQPAPPAAASARHRQKIADQSQREHRHVRGFSALADELEKVGSPRYGADTLMDLSTGGDIGYIRRTILARTPLPVGTVPIYQAAIEAIAARVRSWP